MLRSPSHTSDASPDISQGQENPEIVLKQTLRLNWRSNRSTRILDRPDTTNGVIDCLSGLFNSAALWIHADKGGFPMSAAVGVRDDYTRECLYLVYDLHVVP